MIIPVWAFYTVLALAVSLLVYQLHRTIEDERNEIDWWQFISSRGRDGKQYADLTKLGQAVGILLCFFSTIYLSSKVTCDAGWLGFAGVLSVVLLYLGGVQVYQTLMRARADPQPPKEKEE